MLKNFLMYQKLNLAEKLSDDCKYETHSDPEYIDLKNKLKCYTELNVSAGY